MSTSDGAGEDLSPVDGDIEVIALQVEDDDEVEATEEVLDTLSDSQKAEAEAFAREFLVKVARLRGVRIDRAQFLRSELHKRGFSNEDIQRAIEENPSASGVPLELLDAIDGARAPSPSPRRRSHTRRESPRRSHSPPAFLAALP